MLTLLRIVVALALCLVAWGLFGGAATLAFALLLLGDSQADPELWLVCAALLAIGGTVRATARCLLE